VTCEYISIDATLFPYTMQIRIGHTYDFPAGGFSQSNSNSLPNPVPMPLLIPEVMEIPTNSCLSKNFQSLGLGCWFNNLFVCLLLY
jgi:hypothetical protein